MMNTHLQPSANANYAKILGIRLRAAREAKGLSQKETAMQLCLHENILIMMETGSFKTDIPLTFIRGYIKNYAKFLNIADQELAAGLHCLTPPPVVQHATPSALNHHESDDIPRTTTHAMPAIVMRLIVPLFIILCISAVIGLMIKFSHTSSLSSNMIGDNLTQFLLRLIIFLILIEISVRLFSKSTAEPAPHSRINKPFRLGIPTHLFILASLITLITLANTWWHKENTSKKFDSLPKVIQPRTQPASPAPNLAVDISILAPDPTLTDPLSEAFKINALQALANELNNYVNQAEIIHYDLTTPDQTDDPIPSGEVSD